MRRIRNGFTMIELIFVIVVIGVLAAIAIPKLSATRDDAKQVAAVQNLATCITDIQAGFVATRSLNVSQACNAVGKDACFAFSTSVNHDGTYTFKVMDKIRVPWCTGAHVLAKEKHLSSPSGVRFDLGGHKTNF